MARLVWETTAPGTEYQPYYDLAGRFLRDEAQNPDYWRGPCGRLWAACLGLDADYMYHEAGGMGEYMATARCRHRQGVGCQA